jgi:4-hydroxybenzoate polyprenyltransferase
LFFLPIWLLKGKASFKKKISFHVEIDIPSLPFNWELINWLKFQKKLGRKLILCTAADLSIAKAIADYLNLFDDVMASDGQNNLAGKNKAHALVIRFGEKQFDYAGNSSVDLSVWTKSKQGIVINGSRELLRRANLLTEVEYTIPRHQNNTKTWARTFRIHQWIKNLLIFIPIFAAHQTISWQIFSNLFMAFLSFGFCASAVYMLNDLSDLESDRKHPRKRFRSFASGVIPIWIGILLSFLFIIFSMLLASQVEGSFLQWLLVYFGLTCAYSWTLKRVVLVDCLTLSILYTLRIVAGAAAVSVPLSFWLLAFSIFLFLSLAFIKRYAELQIYLKSEIEKAFGRGYYVSDSSLVRQLGVTSGYCAVMVLALYLNSENVVKLYRAPEVIWGAIPLMILWVSWMWLKADRGLMHDDPIVFAIKDRTSILIGILFIGIFILASVL